MKTTRTIAWTALAGLLVIGPLTMTRAHDFPWPGPFSFPLTGTQVSSGGAGLLTVDLRADGFSASALAEATEVISVGEEFEIIRVDGLTDYIVIVTPGTQEGVLIQIDVSARPRLMAYIHSFLDDDGGHVIICPKATERPDVLVSVGGYEDGMDAQSVLDAAMGGALVQVASWN